MSNKIQVTLDATKLRNLVTKRNYKNKDGQDVELQEVKFELVPVKEPKTIFTKDNMRIDKTHFACVIQTKEHRDAKAPTIYIGEGFSTIWLNDIPVYQAVEVKENPNDDLGF
jgi:hypothetical protein